MADRIAAANRRWAFESYESLVSQHHRPRRARAASAGHLSFGDLERMIHFRIIGSVALLAGLVNAAKFPIDLSAMPPNSHGVLFWISQFLVEAWFVLILVMGWGLIRLRHWAALCGRLVGVISLGVCFWFILTQGLDHGPEPYVAIWFGVALSGYTIFTVWRFRPYDRIAPNAG